MKTALTIIVFSYAIQVVSSAFDLYGSMDDARSAIMSFYDPTFVEPVAKPLTILRPNPVRVKADSGGGAGTFKKTRNKFVGVKPVLNKRKMSKETGLIFEKFASRGSSVAVASVEDKSLEVASIKSLSLHTFRPFVRPLWRRFTTPPTSRPFTTTRPTQAATIVKPVVSKRASLNKFVEAIEDIEKALADAQIVSRVRHDEQRLRKLIDLIRTAVQKRSYRFARKAIGEAMFTIEKMNEER